MYTYKYVCKRKKKKRKKKNMGVNKYYFWYNEYRMNIFKIRMW